MKNFLLSVLLLLVFSGVSYGQFDDILKKAGEKVKIAELPEEKNISTSLSDAQPEAYWLNTLESQRTVQKTDDYSFEYLPGYYRLTVKTFCLKAGTQRPSSGNGYKLAPLKGRVGDVVENILVRSAEHPEIAQKDVQLLLWAIQTQTKFTDLPVELQARVKPLLETSDMVKLEVNPTDIALDLLPDNLTSAAKYYKDMRNRMTNPTSNFEDIENFVFSETGVTVTNPFKEQINRGMWYYLNNGYYARLFPEAYYKSDIELYRPSYIEVTRDDKGRVTSYGNDEYKISVTYDDEPGRNVFTTQSGKQLPIWRFKSIQYTGPTPEWNKTIENTGWILRYDKSLNSGSGFDYARMDDPTEADYSMRKDFTKRATDAAKKYAKDQFKKELGQKEIKEFDDVQHMKDGIEAATDLNDFEKKMEWIQKNLEFTTDWFTQAINELAGGDDEDNQSKKKGNKEKKKVKPEKKLFVPSGKGQRLGVSVGISQ
ncbi:MAG: hypothetical protein MUE56_06240 [Ignavibacteria bacterium]|jgi:hypothetical protein|nr:hypothetical protein [Ignavibacteria bacterium]